MALILELLIESNYVRVVQFLEDCDLISEFDLQLRIHLVPLEDLNHPLYPSQLVLAHSYLGFSA